MLSVMKDKTVGIISIRRQMQIVADQGYAIDDEEMDADVRCVSAPIYDYSAKIVGAISASGPIVRFTDERMNSELIPQVKRAAAEISQRLGYRPDKTLQRL